VNIGVSRSSFERTDDKPALVATRVDRLARAVCRPRTFGSLSPVSIKGDKPQYVLEPQRIAYANGGIYLIAWVPAYGAMRTFAVERIETFGLLDKRSSRVHYRSNHSPTRG
jgi:hypothetical protein